MKYSPMCSEGLIPNTARFWKVSCEGFDLISGLNYQWVQILGSGSRNLGVAGGLSCAESALNTCNSTFTICVTTHGSCFPASLVVSCDYVITSKWYISRREICHLSGHDHAPLVCARLGLPSGTGSFPKNLILGEGKVEA